MTYPNLALIEERFRNLINKQIVKKKEETLKEGKPWYLPEFELEVFPQVFPNAAGVMDDGKCMSGMYTRNYITIIHEIMTDIYGVFGGDSCAYLVTDAPDVFFNDIKEHTMATVGEAEGKY